MQGYELSVSDYFRVLKKHKYVVLLVTLLAGGLTYGFTRLHREIPLFRASASLKINTQEVSTGYLMGNQYQNADPIETHLIMLKSFRLAVIVSQSLDLLPGDVSDDRIKADPELLSAVLGVQNMITVDQEPSSRVLSITVDDPDPETTQRVANAYAQAYKTWHYNEKIIKTKNLREFVEEQLRQANIKLRESEDELRRYSEKTDIVDFSLQEESLLRQLADIDTKVDKADQDIKETLYIISYIQKNQTLPTRTSTELILASSSPNFAKLNSSLVDMNMQKANMLLSYKEDYPPIAKLDQTISSTIRQMVQELKAQVGRMKEEQVAILHKKDELNARYKKLPESKLEMARLQRQVDANSSLYNQLQVHLQEAQIKEAEKHDEITIIKPALTPSAPINSSSPMRKVLLGLLLGFLLGVVLAIVYENLDTSFETIEEVSNYVESPILGVIPFMDFEELKQKHLFDLPDIKDKTLRDFSPLILHYAPKSPIAEAYRIFRTTLDFILEKQNIKVILITASSLEEGKSITASNLAHAFAQLGKRTLLVDTDLRRPNVHPSMGLNRSPGFSDIVLQNCELADATNNVLNLMMGKLDIRNILRIPGIDNLDIITCGTSPQNPSELLNSPEVKAFTERVRSLYDLVIFDTTPILPVTDASILSTMVDGVILVYRSGEIPRKALKRAKVILDTVHANLLGVLINGIKAEVSSDIDYLKYSSYYYAGETKKKDQAEAGRSEG